MHVYKMCTPYTGITGASYFTESKYFSVDTADITISLVSRYYLEYFITKMHPVYKYPLQYEYLLTVIIVCT